MKTMKYLLLFLLNIIIVKCDKELYLLKDEGMIILDTDNKKLILVNEESAKSDTRKKVYNLVRDFDTNEIIDVGEVKRRHYNGSERTTLQDENRYSGKEYSEAITYVHSANSKSHLCFPFVVKLAVDKIYKCTGSIVRRDLILTAATCLYDEDPKKWNVFYCCSSTTNNNTRHKINIIEFIFHPQYVKGSYRNNLIFAKLDGQINLKYDVQKPVTKIDMYLEKENLHGIVTVVGWKSKEPAAEIQAEEQLIMSGNELNIVEMDFCLRVYHREPILNSICVGLHEDKIKDEPVCGYQAGAPVLLESTLLGVISKSPEKCESKKNNYYLVTIFHEDRGWINKIMKSEKIQFGKTNVLLSANISKTLKHMENYTGDSKAYNNFSIEQESNFDQFSAKNAAKNNTTEVGVNNTKSRDDTKKIWIQHTNIKIMQNRDIKKEKEEDHESSENSEILE